MQRGMQRDPEVEAVGMREAMRHEREQGWQPEDVSVENLGFDLRSTRTDADGAFAEVRYVDVRFTVTDLALSAYLDAGRDVPPEIAEKLRHMARSDPDDAVRYAAQRCLRELRARSPGAQK